MKALPLAGTTPSIVPGMTVYLHVNSEMCRCTVKSVRKITGYFILSCNEITGRDRAAAFRGALLSAPPDCLPPRQEGEYLREEIVGLAVTAADGEELGRIVDIIATPAHDVYVVADGVREYLIPAVKEFILEISQDKAKIVVKKMEGLFD